MPGTDIISCGTRQGSYVKKSGTSMAVPIVSGIIALLLSKDPSLTPNEVKLQLYRSAAPYRDGSPDKMLGNH